MSTNAKKPLIDIELEAKALERWDIDGGAQATGNRSARKRPRDVPETIVPVFGTILLAAIVGAVITFVRNLFVRHSTDPLPIHESLDEPHRMIRADGVVHGLRQEQHL